MVVEAITYGTKTVGHNNPDLERKVALIKHSLIQAFERWLKEVIENPVYEKYDHAVAAIKDVSVTVEEAHQVVLAYAQHPNIDVAGAFLSAVYNKVPDEVIVFDLALGTELYSLGTGLTAPKVLVTVGRTDIGDFVNGTKGVIKINYGKVRNSYNYNTNLNLSVVNYGTIDAAVVGYGEVVVNFGTIRELRSISCSKVLNFGRIDEITILEERAAVINTTQPSPPVTKLLIGYRIDINQKTKFGRVAGRDEVGKNWRRMTGLANLVNEVMRDFSLGKDDYHQAVAAAKKHAPTIAQQIKTERQKYISCPQRKWKKK